MSRFPGVLRHPNFRYLFLGQAASAIGDRIVVVAIAIFVTQRTGSATDLGLVLGAQALTLVGLLLFGGVWADRLPRHRIMIAADTARAALHGVVAVLIFAGSITVWELVVIEAMFGAAQAFFQPAYSGLLPQTVPEAEIQSARALTEAVFNLAFLVGPALATVLVLGLGAGEAFALDALTFVLSAALLMRVRPRQRQSGAGSVGPEESVLDSLKAGWREVRSRTWVWVTIAVFTGSILCVYAQWYALAPGIARAHYGGVGVFGLMEAVIGAGAVIGGVVGFVWRPRHPLRVGMLLVLSWPVNTGLFALGSPLVLLIAIALVTGFGWSLLMVWWETALAHHIPAGALSRVSAWDWMGSLALLPLGYLIAGPLADAIGARVVLALGSLIGLLLLALALASRSVRELGGEPEGELDAARTPASAARLTEGVFQPRSSRARSV